LWKEDFKVSGNKKKDWHHPSEVELDQSTKDMKRLHVAICKEPATTTSSTDAIASGLRTTSIVAADPTWNDQCI